MMKDKFEFYVLSHDETLPRWFEWLTQLSQWKGRIVYVTTPPDVLPEKGLCIVDARSFVEWHSFFNRPDMSFPLLVVCHKFEECRSITRMAKGNVPLLCCQPVLKWIDRAKFPDVFNFLLSSVFMSRHHEPSPLIYIGVMHDLIEYPLFLFTEFASFDDLSLNEFSESAEIMAQLEGESMKMQVLQRKGDAYLVIRENESVVDKERNEIRYVFHMQKTFHEILSDSQIPFFSFLEDGQILHASPNAKEILRECFGKELRIPSSLSKELLIRLREHNPTHIPLRFSKKHDEKGYFLLVFSLKDLDTHPVLYGFIDISPIEYLTYDMSHISIEVAKSFLDIFPVPLGNVLNEEEILLNKRARDLLHISGHEPVISLDTVLQRVYFEDRDYVRHAFSSVFSRVTREITFQFTTEQLPRRLIECRIGSHRIGNEREVVMILLEDVTDRVHNLRRFSRREGFLSARKLIYRIGHEFNNIGNLIEHVVGLVEESSTASDSLTEWASILRKEYEKAHKTVSNLLVFSSIASEERGMINLYLALESVLEQFEQMIPENIKFIKKFEEARNIEIEGSLHLFQLALSNIFENSVTILESGGEIEIAVERISPQQVAEWGFEYTLSKPYVHIMISDTGPGMELEKIARYVNSEFIEYDDPTRLGLFQVRSIIEDMGGFFHIESRPGEGTTNHIFVPIELDQAS